MKTTDILLYTVGVGLCVVCALAGWEAVSRGYWSGLLLVLLGVANGAIGLYGLGVRGD